MRTPDPTPIPAMPPAPVGELGTPQDVYPDPLPLDVLANTGPGDDLLSWLIIAASVLILGGLVVAAFRWIRGDS